MPVEDRGRVINHTTVELFVIETDTGPAVVHRLKAKEKTPGKVEDLERFCFHFRDRAAPLISSVIEDRFVVPELMAPNIKGLQEGEKEHSTFFAAFSSLSSREKHCVRLMLEGKSAESTGKILNLSRRTVEYYLDSVKSKLGCKRKSDLIELFNWRRFG